MQQNPFLDRLPIRGKRSLSAHEITKKGAQTQTLIFSGKHQMRQEIHVLRLADRVDGFWPVGGYLRYHSGFLRHPADPVGAASSTELFP